MAEKTIRQEVIDYKKSRGMGKYDALTEKELERFERGWADMMVKIWQEKLVLLGAVHTGALYRSMGYNIVGENGRNRQIAHRFLLYGLYVENGSGNGYKRGNGGNLAIRDEEYRKQHKMGKTREKRFWFSKRYYASIQKLYDIEARAYSLQYVNKVREGLTQQMMNIQGSGFRIARTNSPL